MNSFGTRLRHLRGNRKQSDISKALGIGSSSYTMYENDQRQPNYDMLCKLADFYNVSADYLLGRTDCKSQDIDEQSICRKTGLSGDAVSRLIKIKEHVPSALTGDALEDRTFSGYVYESVLLYVSLLISDSAIDEMTKTCIECAYNDTNHVTCQKEYEEALLEISSKRPDIAQWMTSPFLRQKALFEKLKEQNETTTKHLIRLLGESVLFEKMMEEVSDDQTGAKLFRLNSMLRGHSEEFPVDFWN